MGGLITQLQVVYALFLREVKTRFGKHKLGYGWALLEPLLWVGTFYVLFSLLGRSAPAGMPLFAFLITGFVPFGLFRNVVSNTTVAVESNKGLLAYPRIRPLDLVFSRALLEFVTQFMVFTILIATAGLIEDKLPIDNVLVTLLGIVLVGALGGSLGLMLCGLVVMSPTVSRIQGPILRPLMWFSAVFYPLDAVPSNLREMVLYNPLAHAIELVRYGWFAGYSARYVSASYPLYWVLVMAFFGLTLERVARRRLELS